MSVLTNGRKEILCRNNIGGVKNVYIFSYDADQTFILNGQTVVSASSSSTLYKFEIANGNFSESITNDENGIVFNQSVSFRLFKQNVFTTNELNALTNFDFRYIVEFNDGSLKLGGLYNGAKVSSLNINSGGAKQDFTGYDLTFESAEELESPYLDNLEVITGEAINYIFENGNNFIFQDNNNFIFN